MKKGLIVIGLLLCFSGISYADIAIDISGSQVEIQDSTTMRVRNLTVPGYEGRYWVDFQWNPASLVFTPTGVGEK
jgi:hypothetical protein